MTVHEAGLMILRDVDVVRVGARTSNTEVCHYILFFFSLFILLSATTCL